MGSSSSGHNGESGSIQWIKKHLWLVHIFFWVLIAFLILFLVVRVNEPCPPSLSTMQMTFFQSLLPCNPPPPPPPIRATEKNASLVLAPPVTLVKVGDRFLVPLIVRPSDFPINVVYASLAYPTSVRLIAQDASSSPFAIRLHDPDDDDSLQETMQMQPGPGINWPASLATFTFLALRPGVVSISITSGSQVLADDGFGTNVLGSLTNATITIVSASAAQ